MIIRFLLYIDSIVFQHLSFDIIDTHMTKEQNSKKLYITIASIVSCMSVLILHVNGNFWTYTGDIAWIKANIIECIFYPAVPVFFMITGVTLMDYRDKYNTKTYIKKRVSKTVIPFFIWSIFSVIYAYYFHSAKLSLAAIIDMIINTKATRIYWFFIPLFTLYILIPFLSLIPKDDRRRIFIPMILLTVGFSVISTVFQLCGISYNYDLTNGLYSYSIYLFLGYCIDQYPLSKKTRYLIYLMGIFGLLFHIFGTQSLSLQAGTIVKTFKGYTNFPCIAYSTAVFVCFKYIPWENCSAAIKKILYWIYPTTFGVYLIQYYVLDQVLRHFAGINLGSITQKAGVFILVYFLCVILIKVAKCIPGIRDIC